MDGKPVKGLKVGIHLPESAAGPVQYSLRLVNVSRGRFGLAIINSPRLFEPSTLIVIDAEGRPVSGFGRSVRLHQATPRSEILSASGPQATKPISTGGRPPRLRLLRLALEPGTYRVKWRYALPPPPAARGRFRRSVLGDDARVVDWHGEVETPEVTLRVVGRGR